MTTLFGRKYDRRALLDRVGDMSQLAGARKAELVEGNERGADLIEVFNASGLCFSVLPGRALDIASAHYKGMSLCFRSNTGDVGPAFYEPQGFGWMRGFFGGLVLSCGMTFTGHPEVDPEEENEELGLHGRLAFLPAKNVVTNAGWEGEQYVVRVHGKMREAVVFGTNLELTREISTVLGEKSLHIYDRIENLSVDPSPLMFVYHTNPGFPVLDSGTRLLINSEKTTEWLEDREVGPRSTRSPSRPRRRPATMSSSTGRSPTPTGLCMSAWSTISWGWDCTGSSPSPRFRWSTSGSISIAAHTSPVWSRATSACWGGPGTAGRGISKLFSPAKCGRSIWRSGFSTGPTRSARLRESFRTVRSE